MSLPPPAPRMADLAPEQRPRERLRAHGPAALTDAETLAVLIGNGVRGANATVVAQQLLARFGGIDAVARAGVVDLARQRGIGEVAACRIVASFELRRRMNGAHRAPRVTTAAELAALVGPCWARGPTRPCSPSRSTPPEPCATSSPWPTEPPPTRTSPCPRCWPRCSPAELPPSRSRTATPARRPCSPPTAPPLARSPREPERAAWVSSRT
uniref:UPF0758 domain-containing protein n=1 Tax=Rathayibacter sp. VKM Ac-2630 TaxID=1938617 RepID=UPI001F32B060|nr:UPF0758 domain-containing protein [Rathayibacter sp. VKM Ac-2630]